MTIWDFNDINSNSRKKKFAIIEVNVQFLSVFVHIIHACTEVETESSNKSYGRSFTAHPPPKKACSRGCTRLLRSH